ncbi:MAG: hypothetical protein P8Y03_20600 [Anaerolineales bacterium]
MKTILHHPRIGIGIGLFLMLTLILAVPVQAFETREGGTVTIGADEVIDDDLYVGANVFTLNGTVKGDLFAAGSTVTINGVVEGDLFAAGQSVIINGQVGDDARIAGFALTIGENASIADDVMAAGFSLETASGSEVGGDVAVAGAQALLGGTVRENLAAGVGGLELRGAVGGDVNADVGEAGAEAPVSPFMFMPNMPRVPTVRGGLTVADSAQIGGNLKYTSAVDVSIPAAAVAGQITREAPVVTEGEVQVPEPPTGVGSWIWFRGHLRNLISLLLAGLLMAWVVPKFTRQTASTVEKKPLPSFGWGIVAVAAAFVALMVVIAAVVILAIVLGFISLGGLTGTIVWVGILAGFMLVVGVSLAIGYVSKIAVSYLGGRMILERTKPEWAESRFWPMVLGVIIFAILVAIPFLGGIINLIVVLLGLGALWILGMETFQRPQAVAAESAD